MRATCLKAACAVKRLTSLTVRLCNFHFGVDHATPRPLLVESPPLPLAPQPHPLHPTPSIDGILQVSSVGDTPLLRVAAARLANAMVAVLGPEFTLGSLAYQRIKSLVTDRGALQEDGVAAVMVMTAGPAGNAEGMWAGLEQVGGGCESQELYMHVRLKNKEYACSWFSWWPAGWLAG